MSLYSWLRSWKSLRSNTQTIRRRTAKPGKKPARFRPMLEVLEDRVTPSHFRYGTIDWAPAAENPNQVNFHLTQAWRTDYPFGTIPTVGGHVSTGTFAFGDGSSANIDLTVKAINTSENWFIGEWTTTHTYSGTGNFIASMDSGARISTLKNNADGNYRTETRVNVGGAGSNNPFPGNASAVSSLPAIIQVPDNQVWKFQLPAIDQNGDNLTYRLATNSEAGYGSSSSGIVGQPTGFSISPTGLITWDVRDSVLNTSPGNLWTSQIMVEDHSPDGSVKSWVPVDFILQITDPQQVAPTVVASPTGPFQPTAFTTLSFNVTATAQTGFNITNLQALNAPAGMTFSTFGSPANTKTITATWTPTQAQANQTFVVTFQASDNHSPALTGTTSVTISPQAAFFSTTTTISASPVTYNADGAVTVKVSSSGGGTPTGNVLLSVDGGTPLTGTLDASGSATFILPTPDAGSRKLAASYAAQGSFLTSSATGTLQVAPAPTAVQIQVADVTYDDDGKARVTVTSAAGVPSGIVTLSVNGGPPLTQNLVNGSTTFILSAPEAGIYDLHAEFPAQGNYAASTADARLNVSQASTFLMIDAPTVTYNNDATVTLSVNAPAGVPTPVGTVTLTIDNDTTLSAALVNGGASFTFSGLTAGDHELHAAYALQGSYAGSTADALLHVNPAPTALFIDAPTVTYNSDGTVTLTVSPPDGVPVPTGTVTLRVDNENPLSATLVNGNATFTLPSLDAGDHNLYADYSAQGNYASSAAVGNLHVNPAPLTVTVADVSKVYGREELEFSATVTGLLNGDAITTAFDSEGTHDDADVGIYDIMTALFAQGSTKLSNYDIHMQGGMVTVTPADLNVTANDNSKIYGQTASDTGTVTGVAGHDEITADFLSDGDALTANAGIYSITAALDVHQGKLSNYTVHFTDGTLTVHKADAAIAVSGYSGVYDGNVHGATGTATSVQGESLSGLNLGAGFIDAPGSTAFWTFTDQTGNYNDAYGSVEIIITKASPVAAINGVGPITYDGQAHGTTGTVVGVGGAVLSATVAYTDGKGNVVAAPVSAGSYTATVSYAGDNNYDAASASTTIIIDRAAPKVSVVAGSFTYDGTPHPATGSVTGVGGSNLGSPLFTYSYTDDNGNVVTMNGAPVDPGYYTVTASFVGDENYTAASASATLIIAYNAQSLTDLSRALNSGRTIPIKIRLTDAAGKNVSSSSIDLTAVRLERVNADGTTTQVSLQDAGNSNPGNLFRYDASLGGYIFNLSTKGLGAGAYNFFWTAEGDPTQHELSFKLA